jgi:hypothetical protein
MRRRRLRFWQRPFLALRFSCSAVIAPCGSSICPRPCGRDVRQVHQHILGAVHVEYLAAGTLHKTTARLAGSIAGRLKPLASIPQRISSRGPISLIAPRLKIGLDAFRQEHLPCSLEIGSGLGARCRTDVRPDVSPDRIRSSVAKDRVSCGLPMRRMAFSRV